MQSFLENIWKKFVVNLLLILVDINEYVLNVMISF